MQIIGTVIYGKIVNMQGDISGWLVFWAILCIVIENIITVRRDPCETTFLYIHTRQNGTKPDWNINHLQNYLKRRTYGSKKPHYLVYEQIRISGIIWLQNSKPLIGVVQEALLVMMQR
jgi:hypothetical protein